jgi:hypothetical protein
MLSEQKVDRRSVRVETFLQKFVDLIVMRILVKVGTEYCKNQYHRKGKGSLAMQISQGLVEPNPSHKLDWGKGQTVNIPLLF